MNRTRLAALAVTLALAGCGSTATSGAASPPASPRSSPAPAASPSSAGAALCAKLKAAVDPLPAYLNAVISQDSQISSFSTASSASVERAAKAEVAGWIAVWCPRFAYLAKGG